MCGVRKTIYVRKMRDYNFDSSIRCQHPIEFFYQRYEFSDVLESMSGVDLGNRIIWQQIQWFVEICENVYFRSPNYIQ